MNYKKLKKHLIYFNEWRRGGDGEMPDPKKIGNAIDKAIKVIDELEFYKQEEYRQREMREHYEELFKAGVKELKAYKLFTDHLYYALAGIEAMTTDNLAKKICELERERHNLDKMIHARKIFGK